MKKLLADALFKFSLGFLMVFGLVFIPSGSIKYINGWLFMASMFLPILIIGIVLLFRDPALLKKRLNGKEKARSQDIIVKLSGLVFITSFITSALDYHLRLTYIPFALSVFFSGTLLISYIIYFLVLRENRYLSRIIEVQNGQKVIDTGLYSIIRHPMYSATTLMFLSIPLVLGSVMGFSIMLLYPVLISKRIKGEEEFLSQNLDGYDEYMKKVKYRIIPLIW